MSVVGTATDAAIAGSGTIGANEGGLMPRGRDGLSAAVLTGGQSRRMGTDKALLKLDERALLAWVIDAVSTVSDDVLLVGDRPEYHRFGIRVVADDLPGAGALGGIATALRHAIHDRVLVVACDMPAISVRLLDAMASLASDAEVVVPLTDVSRNDRGPTQMYQPLHAIYRRSCLPIMERHIAEGRLKVADFMTDARVCTLPEEWLRQYDPALSSFDNINSPDDLARIRSVRQERVG